MNRLTYKFAALGLMLVLLGACSKQAPTEPSNPNPPVSFENVIAAGGDFAPVVEVTDTTSIDTTIQDVVGGEAFFCTRMTVNATEAPGEFPLFDPNADLIFPGNLLQGASLEFATPEPIPVKRGPGTIVMVVDNGADSVSRTIPEVNLSQVFNAKNGIIADNPGILPARFSFSFEEVHSRQQMALALDVSFKNLSTDVSASLSFSSDQEYNRYVVKLNQAYFTIAYQLPTTKAEIFDPSVTPERLADFVGPGNPPAFISSVTYGRIFYLLVESTSKSTEIDASLNASFGAAVAQGSLGADAKYVSDLQNVRIKAFALGGEQSSALGAITTDFETLKDFLAKGGDIRTGVPLSYVVRSLARPDKIVKVKVATEYDVVSCVPVGESVENPILWYRADHGISKTSGNHVTRWANFFGKSEFDALPPTKAYGGRWVKDALPGPNLPAVRCLPGEGSASNEGVFGISGVNFVGTDYTLWMVARLGSLFATYPENILSGTGTLPGQNVTVGFRNANQVSVSNLFDTLNVTVSTPVDQFKLYTVRFSQTDGCQVYVNGSLIPTAALPSMNQRLTGFLGARLGSNNGNSVYIAEFKAYGTAVSDLQLKALDKALLVKYGL